MRQEFWAKLKQGFEIGLWKTMNTQLESCESYALRYEVNDDYSAVHRAQQLIGIKKINYTGTN